ncbi:ArsR/SmtB family transcription factor [Spirochaeta lutea]|nr:metalloregulator ArsR/SmtB family transcription factor [Spirochaeta lutea]
MNHQNDMVEPLCHDYNPAPDNQTLQRLADFFKVFGDPTRQRILFALMNKELNVGQIAEALNASQSGISHQLKILRQANLVTFRKEGKTAYYSISDSHVSCIINDGLEHINE